MSFLKFSVTQRRNSLFATRRICQPHLAVKNLNLPKLGSLPPGNDKKSKNEESCNIKSRCSTKIYNGEPLVDNDMPKALNFSSYKQVLKGEINIRSLQVLPSPNDSNFDQIFKSKINVCNYIFDFMQPHIQIKGKLEKTNALKEIFALLSKKSDLSLLTDEDKNLLYNMITKNIFDQDPFISTKNKFSLTIKISYAECSWEHLSLVFKILNQFVLLYPEKCSLETVKKVIRLMNIPDTNERDNLVTFLKNYTKVHPNQFNDIWIQIKNALTNVRCGIYTSNCVEPIVTYMSIQLLSNTASFCTKYLLSILYSHLLPLFDNSDLSMYFNKLSTLIIQIIEKNYDDQLKVIEYLLKHFPIQCGQKQPLFVSFLMSITSTMSSDQLNPIAKKIFAFIAMSIRLPNSKLAESALSFLLKPNLKPIIFSNYENAINILNDPLKLASSTYWEKSIKDQSAAALSMLINAKLEFKQNIALSEFMSSSDLSDNLQDSSKIDTKDLAKTWGLLARTASRRDREIDLTKSLYNIQIEFKKEEKNLELSSQNTSSVRFESVNSSSCSLLKNRSSSISSYSLSSNSNFKNYF